MGFLLVQHVGFRPEYDNIDVKLNLLQGFLKNTEKGVERVEGMKQRGRGFRTRRKESGSRFCRGLFQSDYDIKRSTVLFPFLREAGAGEKTPQSSSTIIFGKTKNGNIAKISPENIAASLFLSFRAI